MTTFTAVGEWQSLDAPLDNHLFKFVMVGDDVIGGVLKHAVSGTGTARINARVWCEPGLIQWEPYGEPRALFSVASDPKQQLSLLPFIVCEICGDKGWIVSGKWVPKDDDEGVGTEPRMPSLESTGNSFRPAIRRELGDRVEVEEEGADRRLYDMTGGPTEIIHETDPELKRALLEEEEIELRHSPFPDRLDEELQRGTHFGSGLTTGLPGSPLRDSGERVEFESGAVRDRHEGKGRYDQLQWFGLRRVALILEKANVKYGDARNYEKGMPVHEFIDSAVRHIAQYQCGFVDEDHLGQAAWNLLAALQTEELITAGVLPESLDDRPVYEREISDG